MDDKGHPSLTLTHDQRAIAHYLGRKALEVGEANGNPETVDVSARQLFNNVNAIAAEIAITAHLNVAHDLTVKWPPAHHDFVLKNGTRVDCKWTRSRNSHLVVARNKRLTDCDLFLSMKGEGRHFKVIGWATPSMVMQDKYLRTDRTGWWVKHYDLIQARHCPPTMTLHDYIIFWMDNQ